MRSMAAALATTPDPGRLTPVEASVLLADLVEVLLPGDGTWPSGRTVGVQGQLVLRLLEQRGKAALPEVLEALVAAGGPA